MRATRILIAAVVVLSALPIAAQEHTWDSPLPDPVPYHFDSGPLTTTATIETVVLSELVHIEGAAWIRMYFGDVQLEAGSFLRISSLADGEIQELDAAGLSMWSNTSGYFNGDSVLVELVAGPGTTTNRMVIDKVASQDAVPTEGCDPGCCGADDRVVSEVDWAGRLLPAGCTASVYNEDSCGVSAGHCIGGAMVIEFKVPLSNPNCTTNHPPIEEQFPVTEFAFTNGGIANDWSALVYGENNLGQTPYERYGEFRPIAPTPPAIGTPAEVWGYGADDTCTTNYAQQTSGGFVELLTATGIRYSIDVTFGNSGSGVLANGTEIVGIVTHCCCPNWGTRMDHPAFVAAREQLCPSSPAEAADLLGINVTAGTPTSGGIGELEASDDTYLVVEAVHQGVRNNAIVEVTAQSPFPTASELNVAVEVGAAPLSPIFVLFQLFNVSAGKWDNLFFGIIPTNGDAAYEFPDVANPGDYVNGSGHVLLRVVETARFVQTPDGYDARIDHVEVTLRP